MNVFIVDDEKPNRDGLKLLLAKKFNDVNVVGEAESAEEARQKLAGCEVDLLLLDINMPKENGFDLLESLNHIPFLIIFITAYSEYAIRALKANAVDYILKPIDPDELESALAKCKTTLKQKLPQISQEVYVSSLLNTASDFASKKYPAKLTLPYANGFQIITVDHIIYLEAEGNYTYLYFINQERFLVTRNIKEFENLLDPNQFFRVHKSSIINLHFLKEYSSLDGHTAVLQNGVKVVISRRRVDDFMQAINKHSQRI